jgi:hypothetical protein
MDYKRTESRAEIPRAPSKPFARFLLEPIQPEPSAQSIYLGSFLIILKYFTIGAYV